MVGRKEAIALTAHIWSVEARSVLALDEDGVI